jgi:hypothetical protein
MKEVKMLKLKRQGKPVVKASLVRANNLAKSVSLLKKKI